MKLLSNQETGLTLPHAYEEIKGDMRQAHTPKRILNIPIKNVVNKFDKHHKHTIIIKYMPVLSQIYLSIFIFVLCRTRVFAWALLGLVLIDSHPCYFSLGPYKDRHTGLILPIVED